MDQLYNNGTDSLEREEEVQKDFNKNPRKFGLVGI